MPNGLSIGLAFPLLAPNGSAAAPSYSFASGSTSGLYSNGSQFVYSTSGTGTILFGDGFLLRSQGVYGWTSGTIGAGVDLYLSRDAANVLAQRNGANAQTYRLYNDFTDTGNYSRLELRWTGNFAYVMTHALGTGVSNGLVLGTANDSGMYFQTGGTTRWLMTNVGHLLAGADGAYDIGSAGANRPRAAYLGGNTVTASAPVINLTQTWNNGAVDFIGILADFTATAWGAASLLMDLRVDGATKFNVNYAGQVTLAAGQGLHFTSRGYVLPANDGVFVLYNDALTGFSRLCFGGTSAAFPAIKRNGANFDLRLADDSAYCDVNCHDVIASSVYCSNVVAVGANNTNLVLGGAGVTMNLIDSAASFVIAVTGGNTIATFGGGQTLTLNLIDQGLRINNQVSGAGASTGTLTNAPSAGNPNFWLPINIAGTVRYVPCW